MTANRLFRALLLIIEVIDDILELIIDFALVLGENPLLPDLIFIGGLSDDGVDSVELFIGDKDGT